MRFIAIASTVCASVEIEPSDMAPVEKRLTISAAGSTSSMGTGFRRAKRGANRRGGGAPLAAPPPGVFAARIQHPLQHRILLVERAAVDADRFLGKLEHADAFDHRRRTPEILVHQRAR